MCTVVHVLLFIITVFPSFCFLLCPEEHSQVTGTDENITVTWPAINIGFVKTNPLCLDENYDYITRTCTRDGSWDPVEPPSCAAVQKPFEPSCLPSHIQVDGLCVSISPPQPWFIPSAPPAVIDITEPTQLRILHSLGIAHAWLPVRRVEPFGKLVWMTMESWYTEYTHPYLINTSPSYDCVIINILNGTDFSYMPEMADCSSSYPNVHFYSLLDTSYVQTNDYIYSLNTSAFSFLNYKKQGVTEFTCNKLAEPLTPQENYIIKKLFKKVTQNCLLGVELQSNGQYIWQTSGLPISYADWEQPSLKLFHSSRIIVGQNGWKKIPNLASSRVGCAVCEDDLKNYALDLTLQLNKDRTALVLSVYGKNHFLSITCTASGLAQFDFKFDLTNPVIDNDERSVYLLTYETLVYSYYQCKGLTIQNGGLKTIVTKKVLFDYIYHGHRFAFEVNFKQYCAINICDPYVEKFYKYIEKNIQEYIEHSSIITVEIQAKKILSINYDNGDLTLLFHALLDDIEYVEELHEILLDAFENLSVENETQVLVGSLENILNCLPSSTESGNETLLWDYALVGSTVLSRDPCFQADGLPVTRSCTGDRMSGARWSDVAGICHLDVGSAPIHSGIYGIYTNRSEINAVDAMQNLSTMTKQATDLNPSDIYFVSQIFLNMDPSIELPSSDSSLSEDVVTTVSNVMAANTSSLDISNHVLNSTNVLVDTSEQLIAQFSHELNGEGVYRIVQPNLLYQISDPFVQGVTGVAIFKSNDMELMPFTEYNIQNLYANTTVDDLVSDSTLEMAAFVPDQLLNDISVSSSPTVRISIYFYYNDSLFVEGKDENITKVASRVMSISIQGYESYLRSPVRVVLRNTDAGESSQCGYWDFGSVADDVTYPSQWVVDAGLRTDVLDTNDNYEICEFLHLTHFALLLGIRDDPYYKHTFSNDTEAVKEFLAGDTILDMITITGCILSLFGISIILLTAIVFKSWRESLSTKILLNVSVCILMQMIVLYVADLGNIDEQGVVCVMVGALLHYLVLCGFCWSGVAALLQWRRLVRVLGVQEPHLLLRAGLAGWVVPSVPVAAMLLLDAGGYNSGGLCYPQGTALYAALLAPGAIIILLNLILFAIILRGISQQQMGPSDGKRRTRHLHWVVLLFFLLGLPWALGFLATSGYCDICIYLFCATSTVQGFVLGMFCVVFQSSTRALWAGLFCKTKKRKTLNYTNCSKL